MCIVGGRQAGNVRPGLLAQLLALLSFVLEHDETGLEPRVALM